jgi:hypothetical protein
VQCSEPVLFVVCAIVDAKPWSSIDQLRNEHGESLACDKLAAILASHEAPIPFRDHFNSAAEIVSICPEVNIQGTLLKGLLSQGRARRKSPDSAVVELDPVKSHETLWVVHPAILECVFLVQDRLAKRVLLFAQIRRFTNKSVATAKFRKRLQSRLKDCPEIASRFCEVTTSFGYKPFRGGDQDIMPLQCIVGKLVLVPYFSKGDGANHAIGAKKIAHARMPWGLAPPFGSGGLSVEAGLRGR